MRKFAILWMLLLAGTASGAVLAHYSFDSDYSDVSGNGAGGTLVDVGTTGNSGVTTNADAWVFGGGALHLDAERDYLSVTSRTFNSGVHPYSIAFWAKRSGGDTGGAAQWDMVIGQRDSTSHYIALGDAGSTNALHWRGNDTTAARNQDFASVNDTNWHHHVLTADTSQSLRCYLDGTLVSVATGKLTGFVYDTIGEAYAAASDYDFNGQIDEVWIFNEAIAPAAVSNLYLSNVVAAASTSIVLALHYAFESNLTDSSPASNHGTASGAAMITNGTALPVGSGALQLDGADTSYVALSTTIQFSASEPWTVAFWAQRGELGGQKGMAVGQRFTTTDFIWLNDTAGSGLRFRSSANQTTDFAITRDLAPHHYALVASGNSTLALYVDGALFQSVAKETSFKIDSVGQAYTTNLHYAFQGLLDDVRVYSGALGSSAILALYQMNTNAPASTNVTTNAVSGVTRLHVVLQGGQSNSDGRGEPAGLPAELQSPQTNIDFYYREGAVNTLTTLRPGTSATAQFGPEVTCGRGYHDLVVADASTRVAIIKYARGGTSLISDWKPGGNATTTGDGPDYVIFQQTVANGLAALAALHTGAVITIDGMTWMQGESDSAVASTYETNLTAFIADVRATIQTNLPFIIARLSSQQTAVGAGLATLRAAQANVAAADAWSGMVDTDTFRVKTDNLHFDATGQVSLGYAFAYQVHLHQGLTNRFTSAQIAGGTAEPSADADGDGVSNNSEFIGGTDATNAASVLKAQMSLTGPGLFSVSYPTGTGRRYAVDSQADVPGTNWTPVLPLEAGTGTNATRAVTNNAGTGFLRIRATLP